MPPLNVVRELIVLARDFEQFKPYFLIDRCFSFAPKAIRFIPVMMGAVLFHVDPSIREGIVRRGVSLVALARASIDRWGGFGR